MISLNRILVPTDFSDFSQPAMSYALELASRFESELHLLNVIQPSSVFVSEAEALSAEIWREQMESLKATSSLKLAELPGGDWDNGRPVIRKTHEGVAFVEIVQYAKSADVDLIVIGTHGRTGLKHVLLGSVAEKVVRKSPCPVLTVRPEGHQFVMP